MNKERQNTLFVFEGLSCCGKTSLVKRLSRDGVGRGIIRKIPRGLRLPTPEIFMENDEAKFREAIQCNGVALMDRGYLSTLVFYTVMEEMEPGFSTDKVKRWVAESIGKTIFKPDYYVFVEVPPDISKKRAYGIRPFDERNLWMTATDRMVFWYGQCFSTLEKDVSIIRVDGTRGLDSLEKELADFIKDLKRG